NAAYTIGATVTDKDAASASASILVTVNNVAPSTPVLSLAVTTINENGSTSLGGTFTDPGTLDTHTVAINWGDGSSNTTLKLAAGVTNLSSLSHQYLDNKAADAPYTISATVTDKDGGTASAAMQVTVHNVAPASPTLSLTATTINENGSTLLGGTFTDPGT